MEPNPSTFGERKRIQKLIYIAQEFGVDLGFNFTWYIHGPYSPDLIKSIFDVMERNSQVENIDLAPDEVSKLSEIRDFLKEDIQSTETLELIGSLLYLRIAGRKFNASKAEIMSVLKEKKPQFSDDKIEHCWNKLDSVNMHLRTRIT